jgi:microcystin-dependent protein
MARPKIVQARTTFLTSPVTASSTSFRLNRLLDVYGSQLAMSDFGDKGYLTIDPGLSTEEIISFTGFTVNDDNSVTIDTGVVRGLKAQSDYATGATASTHSGGSIAVVSNNPQIYEDILDYIDSVAIAGGADASLSGKGFLEVATETEIDNDEDFGATGAYVAVTPVKLALSKYGLRLPDATGKVFLNAVTGMISLYGGSTAPTGFLNCDGTAYNNDDYPALALIIKNLFGQNTGSTFTANAGTDFITASSHGLDNGDIVFFTTTTTLPAGLSLNTPYYVINKTTNTFQVSTSSGGSAVNITDTGTGTHSFHTQFKVPDLSGRFPIGKGAVSFSISNNASDLASVSAMGTFTTTHASNLINYTAHGLAVGDLVRFTTTTTLPAGLTAGVVYAVASIPDANSFKITENIGEVYLQNTEKDITSDGAGTHTMYRVPHFTMTAAEARSIKQGAVVRATTTGGLPTGLSLATDYYVMKITSTKFALASSITNCMENGTAINLTSVGTGVHTFTLQTTSRTHGDKGGEEEHRLTYKEIPSHIHSTDLSQASSAGSSTGSYSATDGVTGYNQNGNQLQALLPPYLALTFVIKT